MSTINDKILTLNEQLEAKKALYNAKRKETLGKWKTSGKLLQNRSVRAITNASELTMEFAILVEKNRAFNEASQKLFGVDAEIEFGGYTFSDWENDFKIAAHKIELDKMEATIKKIEHVIETYTPEEIRRDKALAEVDELFKTL